MNNEVVSLKYYASHGLDPNKKEKKGGGGNKVALFKAMDFCSSITLKVSAAQDGGPRTSVDLCLGHHLLVCGEFLGKWQ